VQDSTLTQDNIDKFRLDISAKPAFLCYFYRTYLLYPNDFPFEDFSFAIKYSAGEGECAFCVKSLRELDVNLLLILLKALTFCW
jgi:hypothetical protein